MRFLLFSDIHTDKSACAGLVEKARHVDLVIGAGDYAHFREGLSETLAVLSEITVPTILVHGNHESNTELTAACEQYDNFYVLHGETIRLDGYTFVGIGAGIPCTPFGDWSVDLSEKEALTFLPAINEKFILISHSPPYSCLDQLPDGQHMGSKSILNYIKKSKPAFVVCGHIHEQWDQCKSIHGIPVINAGPQGYLY
ncbi:MAG: metallophosphoesterase family protein [Desulfobacteraceae bacterium]|nr:metallophosphoesterase family protein [Desulfobacteraceae bacterium]